MHWCSKMLSQSLPLALFGNRFQTRPNRDTFIDSISIDSYIFSCFFGSKDRRSILFGILQLLYDPIPPVGDFSGFPSLTSPQRCSTWSIILMEIVVTAINYLTTITRSTQLDFWRTLPEPRLVFSRRFPLSTFFYYSSANIRHPSSREGHCLWSGFNSVNLA